jgi:hypothetical protein
VIYLGIDDTDNDTGGGTGRVAREIAAVLRSDFRIAGVTRHQLLVDERVPCTSNNSCNVIHLDASGEDLAALAVRAGDLLAHRCLDGSDPGLCVAGGGVGGHWFGHAAQESLLSQEEARAAGRELGVPLLRMGGSGDGIIGALAGVILAAGGSDGRFVEVGRARELQGTLPIDEIVLSGVDRVCAADGSPVTAGLVDTAGGRVRPLLREHAAVLVVEPRGEGAWQVVEMGKRRDR